MFGGDCSQKDARQSVKHKGSFHRRWYSAGGSLRSAVWDVGWRRAACKLRTHMIGQEARPLTVHALMTAIPSVLHNV